MGTVLKTHWRRIGRSALDLLYPPLCIACRARVAEPGSLCAACWQSINFIEGPACHCCGLPFDLDPGEETLCGACIADPPSFDRARAVMRYDERSRGPILAFKHGDRLDLVPGFARWLYRVGQPLLDDADLIVPVPLHSGRLWTRRYNQAAELSRAIGKRTDKPVHPLALQRIRATPSQGAMPSAKARRRNMHGAFQIPDSYQDAIHGRRVLLIDDVLTTGATADACARVLKRAGARKVHVLALARVVRPLTGII